jgi:hypothetical protein
MHIQFVRAVLREIEVRRKAPPRHDRVATAESAKVIRQNKIDMRNVSFGDSLRTQETRVQDAYA